MSGALPHHPHMADDEITMDIVASTNGQALDVWIIDVSYDVGVLTYQSTSTSSLYTDALVTEASEGALVMSTSGMQGEIEDSADLAEVTGSSIDVVTLRFKVKTSASAGSYGNVLQLSVTQMVNEFSIAFAHDVTGQVNDERGGAQIAGQITVKELSYAGVFAYASVNELANVAPLSGEPASSVVSTVAVYDDLGEGNADVSNEATCRLMDLASATSVMSVSNDCTVTASGAHLTGAAAVGVSVAVGELSANATFRVWFPTAVALDVVDTSLGALMPNEYLQGASSRLERALRLNDTCSMRYQKTELRAYGTFSLGAASLASVTVDVTGLVGFASSDTTVATIVSPTSDVYSPVGAECMGAGGVVRCQRADVSEQ